MTVINNIEIDDIKYCENEIKAAICNNEPIEEKLNVIIVVSNPCQYGTRYLLAREFVRRMELEESNVELYIVELAYNNQQFYITEKSTFLQRFQYFFFIMLIMLFIGTLPSAFQGGSSGIAFGIIFGIIMYMIFAKRIYNEEYQTDPFPNMSSLLDKYKKYYRGSDDNKMQNYFNGFNRYKSKKEKISYDDLSKEISDIKKILQKEIDDYSVAYNKVNTNKTLELNEDPFTKKLRKAKELKGKIGDSISKVGKFVSEKSTKNLGKN